MESCTYCFWMPFMVYMTINGVLVLFSAVLVAYMEVSGLVALNGNSCTYGCYFSSLLPQVREFPKSSAI